MHSLSAQIKDTWLPWFLRGILVLTALLVVGRLIELQIVKGKYYRTLSEGNRVKKITIPAPRGKILARGGEVLAESKAASKMIMFNEIEGYVKVDANNPSTDDIVITEWNRYYQNPLATSHIVGYLGEVNEDEVGKVDPGCNEKGPRKAGAYVGRMGLEKTYNCYLSGIDGEELVEVNTLGKIVRVLGKVEPIAGKDLKTNIDYPLQEKVAGLMGGMKGAIIVTDTSGEVLALYSSPAYDPKNLKELINDPDQALFNRAIGGLYHPGSTYKILVGTAGLEEKVIDINYYYDDKGKIDLKTQFGDFSYANWFYTQNGGMEGKINIVRGLARSCDTFFYNLGELLGVNKLVKWSQKLKLDKKTDIDIPGEVLGLLPTPIWKEKNKGEKWFLGNTYNMAIGQGDLAISPLVANVITETIASGGKLCMPRIAEKPKCEDLRIKEENINIIKKGLADVCTVGGTGYTFFDFNPRNLAVEERIGCKTGTAETSKKETTHAWFTAFAPVTFPEIVLTVLVEEGGEGSKVAGPIAREIMDYWFTR
jgi:penicillin-binding protein 2